MNYIKPDIESLHELIEIRLSFLKECFGPMDKQTIRTLTMQLQRYFFEEINHSLFVYLAQDGDHIISSAFLLVQEKPANPHFLSGKTGLVLNVYTKPEYRGHGYAGRLLTNLLTDAKSMGLSYVELSATLCGRPLYEKLGFLPVEMTDTAMRYSF